MSDKHQVGSTFHKKRVGKPIVMVEGRQPAAPNRPQGRLPRITRYMALAIYYEDLIRQDHVHDYVEIATLGDVTRARVSQIMNLRLLAPDIQERLLSLDRIGEGRDSLCLRDFQSIALESDWHKQRKALFVRSIGAAIVDHIEFGGWKNSTESLRNATLLPAIIEHSRVASLAGAGIQIYTEPRGQYLLRQIAGNTLSERIGRALRRHIFPNFAIRFLNGLNICDQAAGWL